MNAPVRLLVVDDDPDMHVQVRLLLQRSGRGYEIEGVTDPAVVAERLDGAPFDLLLVDHHMCAAHGTDVLRRIRERSDAPPAIVMTMSRDPGLPDVYLDLGAVDFLAKDEITSGLLDRSIRFAIAQWRSRRAIEDGQAALLRSERLATVGRLAAGVAHEYNNLNAVVLAGAELVGLRVRQDEIASRHVGLIIASVERSRRISSALLQLARPAPAVRPAIDMRAQLCETAELLAPEIRRWGADLALHLSEHPCPVGIDRGDLHQVVANLVINALHAVHRTQGARVTLSLDARHGSAVLAVADNGVGIEPQDLARIFDPFFSRKGGHDQEGRFPAGIEGSGLGLAVCQRIIEQAGGRIAVASIPGSGTTLTVTLPLAARGTPASAAGPAAAVGPLRIAVVEDNRDLLASLSALLAEDGHQIMAYDDPRLFLVDLPGIDIDALILDWRMPGLDGLQVLARIADPARTPPLRVLLTSGEEVAMPDDPPGVRIMGFLPKPFRSGRVADLLAGA